MGLIAGGGQRVRTGEVRGVVWVRRDYLPDLSEAMSTAPGIVPS